MPHSLLLLWTRWQITQLSTCSLFRGQTFLPCLWPWGPALPGNVEHLIHAEPIGPFLSLPRF